DKVDTETAQLGQAVSRAGAAYRGAVDDVERYAEAVRKTAEAALEAARREREAEAIRKRNVGQTRQVAERGREMAILREDIQQRSAQARASQVAAEAARRLTEAQEREAASLRNRNVAVQEAIGRQNRLTIARLNANKPLTESVLIEARAENAARNAESR